MNEKKRERRRIEKNKEREKNNKHSVLFLVRYKKTCVILVLKSQKK
jgi:hypothetical protein